MSPAEETTKEYGGHTTSRGADQEAMMSGGFTAHPDKDGIRTFSDAESTDRSALDRVRTLHAMWTERYREAQRQVEKLQERTFVKQSPDRNARVTVDADGKVTEVRVDRSRLPTLSSEQLSASVLAAEQAARAARDAAHNAITQRMFDVDEDGLDYLTNTLGEATQIDTGESVDDSTNTTGEPEIDELLTRLRRYRRMNTQFINDVATHTATGTNGDGCVRADCTVAGATSQLYIDPELLRRPPRNIEHALLRAIEQGRSAASNRREETVEKLRESGNPLGLILSGSFDPDEAFESDVALAEMLAQWTQQDDNNEVQR